MIDVKLELILQEMLHMEFQTALDISVKLNVSEKTIRNRIKELNYELEKHGAIILSKKRFGFRLKIMDETMFHEFLDSLNENNTENLPSTSTERVLYILVYLLNREEYIKIDEICEFLFISRNTLTADLKKSEYILNMYNLYIDRKPNYGIKIKGKEFDRRVCITNTLIKWYSLTIEDAKMQNEIHAIGEIVLSIINKYKMWIPEVSFENLNIHIYIAIKRMKRNCNVVFDEQGRGNIIGKNSIQIATEIADQIQKKFGVIYNDDEILYLAIHLGAKISSDSKGNLGTNMVISSKIDELVLLMINRIYEGFKFDFRNNLELRMNLNQHMVPLDIRMQYGIPLKNPILQQIKKEYALAYTIASGACTALNEYYKRAIPEDEIGYFAMIFALALEKLDKNIEKKNVVIVCVSGKGSSQLFIYKYKQAFGKYINRIFECTIYELEDFDFKKNNIDYVFSTIPLNIKIPVPVLEVNLFLENKDIIAVQELLETGSTKFLNAYYKRELFLTDLSFQTKEEVIWHLCEHAKNYYNLPHDFFDAIMKREELGQTDFGNMIAIPHPYKVITKDNFVIVGILDKPVWWGHNEVKVVFLVALSTEEDADIERFYQLTTNFLFSSEKINKLIQHSDFDVLINLLSNN